MLLVPPVYTDAGTCLITSPNGYLIESAVLSRVQAMSRPTLYESTVKDSHEFSPGCSVRPTFSARIKNM